MLTERKNVYKRLRVTKIDSLIDHRLVMSFDLMPQKRSFLKKDSIALRAIVCGSLCIRQVCLFMIAKLLLSWKVLIAYGASTFDFLFFSYVASSMNLEETARCKNFVAYGTFRSLSLIHW